jgi:hypothetical protein
MKVLLFITGYRQLEEYKYFSTFLKTLKLNSICDVFIYCNNPEIYPEIVHYYQGFDQKNKRLFITTRNAGYMTGGVEAVSEGFEMGIFKDYDYVIHLHPDVFITGDKYLTEVLETHLEDDVAMFITKSIPDDPRFFSFDFFIFKPKFLRNIFKDELYVFKDGPEHYMYDMIMKHEVNYMFIDRFDNNNWKPRRIDDHLKLYHEHDLDSVRQMLKDRKLIKPLI